MKSVVKIWWLSLLIKLVVGAWLPISSDESYYWVWSHHLQLSYFDHPPFVAWLDWVGQFFSWFRAFRWPAIILGHLTLAVWLKIAKEFLPELDRRWFLILLLLNPLTGPGALIVTPDIPLMFFWSLTLLWALRVAKRPEPREFILLGLFFGLGFCSKYHIVLVAPIALAWFYFSKIPLKKFLLGLPLALVAAVVSSYPVWKWNMDNQWASFAFQLQHGFGDTTWKPEWTLMYIVGQVALIFPTVVWFASKSSWRKQRAWLLLAAWFPLAFFLWSSFKKPVEANWPITAYPAVIALALLAPISVKLKKWTASIWAVALTVVLIHIGTKGAILPDKKLKTKEFFQFQEVEEVADNFQPLFARSYQMASKLSYEKRRPIYKLKGMSRLDFYDFQEQSKPAGKKYFLAAEKNDVLPSWAIQEGHKVIATHFVNEQYVIFEIEKP